ncbi:hypothetical protein [Enterococcus crotali]|uniref:hypothetical protein n=1 Tax=Enterococcus crotali TaxID=1453587 RepID=UPI000FE14784|nr:hypothetical protein [Enterococcus crotali]
MSMWCDYNQPSERSFEICEYAFKLINSSEEYRSNAGIYRQLSNQMKSQDPKTTEKMTQLFEGHLDTLQKNGPTIEYVQLYLNIIKANELINIDLNKKHLEEIYSYISLEEDLSIQLECYAHLLKYLHSTDYQKDYDIDLNISELVSLSIDEIINIILSDTAHQYDSLKGTLCLIATIDLSRCLEVIMKVNNLVFRELLYHDIIESLCISTELQEDIVQDFITESINILQLITEDNVLSDDSIEMIISCFYEHSDNDGFVIDHTLVPKLIHIIKKCTSLVTKIQCMNLLSLSLANDLDKRFSEQIQALSDDALKFINSIDLMPLKISLSLQTIKLIGDKNLNLALKYYENVSHIIETFKFIEPMEFWNSIKCVRLLIRAYRGIVESQNNIGKDDVYLPKLLEIVSLLESSGEEAILLSETAIVLFQNNRILEGKEICKRMTNLINSIPQNDKHYKCRVIRLCSPALFLNHKGTFERLLSEMSNSERNQTYYELVHFLFNGYSYSEPIHNVDSKFYSCQYEDLIDICEIIEKFNDDNAQYSIIGEVIKAAKSNYVNLKQEAKNELFRILKEHSQKLFPSKFNIQHEGYKIVAESSVMNANGFDRNIYNTLVTRANALPNKTDKIFVKTMLYADIEKQRHYQKLSEEVFIEGKQKISEIPLTREKIYQLELLAEAFKTKKTAYSKELIESGIKLLQKESDDSSTQRERRLIDMAYQIDPDFGKSLVSTIQSNDVSSKRKIDSSKEHELQNTKYLLKDKKNTPDIDLLTNQQKENIPNICWEWLGLLQGKKNSPKKIIDLYKQYLPFASTLPMDSAYKIYSWLIENNTYKPSSKNMPFEVFEGIYNSCKIIFWKKNDLTFEKSESPSKEGLIVTNSDGREGLDFILKWIEENATKKITICDPYFSEKELDIIQEISFINSKFEFEILTSKEHVDKELGFDSIEGFRSHWKNEISNEAPPEVLIVIAGHMKNKKLPIHDRYILTETKGLYIGGSLNGLNSGREFSISLLSENLFDEWRVKIDQYIDNNQSYFRSHDQKLDIQSFWL